jgi:L-fuconolactonase
MTGYVDAHQHLWTLTEHPQTWMNPATDGPIMRDFTTTDLAAAALPAGVARTILVQSVNDATETDDLLAAADESPLIAGVVGWVDLTARDLVDQIARWRAGPGGGRLVGFRHLVANEPDPGWLDRPDVLRGLRTVAEAGLAFDLLVKEPQLAAALRACHAVPNLRIVLDHLGNPPLVGKSLTGWVSAVRELGQLSNVSAKLSGLVTSADWKHWTVQDLAPAVELAFEAFGPARLMFGSDWPVCLLAAPYQAVVDSAEQLTSGLSMSEHDAVFRHNALDFYRVTDCLP